MNPYESLFFYCRLFQILVLYIFSTNPFFCSVSCHAVSVIVTCCEVWTLGVWGELACHKRLFNPPPQFSRLCTWCPAFVCMYVYVCVCVCVYVCVWWLSIGAHARGLLYLCVCVCVSVCLSVPGYSCFSARLHLQSTIVAGFS